MNSNNSEGAELNETSWKDSFKRTKSSTKSVPPLPISDVHPNAAATHDFTIHDGSLPASVDSPKHLSGNEEPSASLPLMSSSTVDAVYYTQSLSKDNLKNAEGTVPPLMSLIPEQATKKAGLEAANSESSTGGPSVPPNTPSSVSTPLVSMPTPVPSLKPNETAPNLSDEPDPEIESEKEDYSISSQPKYEIGVFVIIELVSGVLGS